MLFSDEWDNKGYLSTAATIRSIQSTATYRSLFLCVCIPSTVAALIWSLQHSATIAVKGEPSTASREMFRPKYTLSFQRFSSSKYHSSKNDSLQSFRFFKKISGLKLDLLKRMGVFDLKQLAQKVQRGLDLMSGFSPKDVKFLRCL